MIIKEWKEGHGVVKVKSAVLLNCTKMVDFGEQLNAIIMEVVICMVHSL